MTMIIISCSEKEMYDISSLSLMAKSKSARLDGYNEYLSLNQINYKYIFFWLAIGYLFLFFVYFLHLFRYRYFNISMQSLLIFYPFSSSFCAYFPIYIRTSHRFTEWNLRSTSLSATYSTHCAMGCCLSFCSLSASDGSL